VQYYLTPRKTLPMNTSKIKTEQAKSEKLKVKNEKPGASTSLSDRVFHF